MPELINILVNLLGVSCLLLGLIQFKYMYIYLLLSFFFIGNIYIYGISLICLLSINIIKNNGNIKTNYYINLISIFWIISMVLSTIGNDITLSMILQFIETFFYIILMFLIYDIFNRYDKSYDILKYLILGSTILGIYNLIFINLDSKIIGINESSLVIVFFGILLPLLLFDKSTNYRWLILVFLNLSLIVLLEARSATLITILSIIIFFIHKLYCNKPRHALIFTISIIIFFYLNDYSRLFITQELLNKIAVQSTSTQERIAMLNYGIDVFWSKPINGYGVGSIEYLMSLSENLFSRHPHPHNNYIYLLMEYGILGLLLKFGFIYIIIRKNHRVGNIISRFKLLFLLSFLLLSLTNVIFYGASRMIPFCILFAYTIYISQNNSKKYMLYEYTAIKG